MVIIFWRLSFLDGAKDEYEGGVVVEACVLAEHVGEVPSLATDEEAAKGGIGGSEGGGLQKGGKMKRVGGTTKGNKKITQQLSLFAIIGGSNQHTKTDF